jgi:DNA uptake protein ComE-like DNA-binding protein
MSFGSTDPRSAGTNSRSQQLLASRAWRWRNSLWLLGPVLGLGMITWASFLYVGRKARRTDWLVAGVLYAVAAAVLFYFIDGTEGPDGESNEWTGGATVALWIAGMVHAFLSNRAWLTWRANAQPWYATAAQQQVGPGPGQAASPELAALGVDPNQYYAAGPQFQAGPPPAPTFPMRPQGFQPPTPSAGFPPPMTHAGFLPPTPQPFQPPMPGAGPQAPVRLDVNSASEQQLSQLPGLTPERVHRAVQARSGRGGFGSVQEFADAAGLAPHEHARIRELVQCSAPPSRTPPRNGSGRIVDF